MKSPFIFSLNFSISKEIIAPLIGLIGLIATGITAFCKKKWNKVKNTAKKADKRSKKLEKTVYGEEQDPTHEGIVHHIEHTRKKVDCVEEKVDSIQTNLNTIKSKIDSQNKKS